MALDNYLAVMNTPSKGPAVSVLSAIQRKRAYDTAKGYDALAYDHVAQGAATGTRVETLESERKQAVKPATSRNCWVRHDGEVFYLPVYHDLKRDSYEVALPHVARSKRFCKRCENRDCRCHTARLFQVNPRVPSTKWREYHTPQDFRGVAFWLEVTETAKYFHTQEV